MGGTHHISRRKVSEYFAIGSGILFYEIASRNNRNREKLSPTPIMILITVSISIFSLPLEGDPYVWVGATNSNPDSEWRWVDGSVIKLDLFPWGRSEPDPNVDQPYLCVKLSGDALFHNCQSSSELFAVCELLADPLLGKNLSFNNFQGNDLVTRRGDPAFKSDFLFGDSELISDTVGNNTNSLR